MMTSSSALTCVRLPLRQSLASNARHFTTSSVLSAANHVPPESPSYIRLPENLDSEGPKPLPVRGHLPVHRQIFDKQNGPRKASEEYIAQTAPEPTKNVEPINATQRWKAKMANSRRENLRGGLNALWTRHSQKEGTRKASERLQKEARAKARAAPERADDRFTRGTILEEVLDTRVLPDPERFARVDSDRNKTVARENRKRDARRDALMELYMNATNFIVKESELQTEIDKVFSPDYFVKQKMSSHVAGAAANAWGSYGKPVSIANMLAATTKSSQQISMVDTTETEHDHAANAQKRIAEEFTGGKME